MNSNNDFEILKNEMVERFYQIFPEIASLLGLHDPFDHQLAKGDLSSDLELEKLLEEMVQRMHEIIKYETLNNANKIDWEILERLLEAIEFAIHEQRQNVLNPDGFDLIGISFFLMISKDYAPLEQRMECMLSRLKEVPRYLKEFRTRFENSKPVKLWTEIALETAQTIPGLFQFLIALGKGQISDKLQASIEEAVAKLDEPLKEHINWLQNLQSNTVPNWALGKKRFERLIALRGLGMTSEEILQFGMQSLKELKTEREKIASQIDPKKSIEEIMKKIEEDSPETFDEALLATRTAMEEAKEFIRENDLATIYEEDKLYVVETPPYMAPLVPFAALIPPSRFDDPRIGLYVVTQPKDVANLKKHLSNPNIRNVAVHEAFPGHFLQLSATNRSSIIQVLSTMTGTLGTETVEGWAHYCEQMMMEKGFVTGLAAKMIQLTGAIWRAVRIIVDVQLSRGEMTFDEAVNMLIKETGMPKEGAVAEVRRYTLTPGYPLSYLLGKHLILQLRDEIRQRMGDQYTDKFFHDTVAANGNLPVSLLRKVFDQKLTS